MEKVRLFSLEIRKFVPLNRRTLIQEENDDFPTFLSHNYEKLEEIGSGAQGKVFKVFEKNSKQVKAIKCMRTRDPELISQYQKEFRLCKSLNHPGIIVYEDYLTQEKSSFHCFLMEYSEYQTLTDFLQNNKEFFKNEDNLKTFVSNLMDIVAYLHRKRIAHRDIKANNLLISPDGQFLKLLDFGVARKFEDSNIMFSPQGDFKYRSPECVVEGGYNEKCDIWACCLLILSLVCGRRITTKKIETKKNNFEKELQSFSHAFLKLLKQMYERNPDERISAEEILNSSWLN